MVETSPSLGSTTLTNWTSKKVFSSSVVPNGVSNDPVSVLRLPVQPYEADGRKSAENTYGGTSPRPPRATEQEYSPLPAKEDVAPLVTGIITKCKVSPATMDGKATGLVVVGLLTKAVVGEFPSRLMKSMFRLSILINSKIVIVIHIRASMNEHTETGLLQLLTLRRWLVELL